ncbi:unnamed protein product [Sphagnum balticum]
MAPASKKNGLAAEQLKIIRNRGSPEEGLTESDLIKQLTFVLNNTNSNDIIEDGGKYQLRAGINVNETVRQIVSDIA